VTCYPNPFNPGTTVSFALARSGPVAVRVFDARGRLVRALLDGQSRSAGRHEIAWDGRDAAGQACASGVYLVRVDAGGQPQTGRMLLVR
jgi:flagellar hook assembly protein FlgD